MSELSEEEVPKLEELSIKLLGLTRDIQDFESTNSQLFEHTAESHARARGVRWWVLNLVYYKEPFGTDRWLPLFGEGTFESKLEKYDTIEEKQEKFDIDVLKKAGYLVSNWYINKAETPEDFADLLKDLEPAISIPE